ncbi:uncharacterized protein DS421_10g298930 [Arachis hypogaea]|nr:uncharacterized protein DS421_10g298930 [Arachis hypogaea]
MVVTATVIKLHTVIKTIPYQRHCCRTAGALSPFFLPEKYQQHHCLVSFGKNDYLALFCLPQYSITNSILILLNINPTLNPNYVRYELLLLYLLWSLENYQSYCFLLLLQ